MGILRDVLAEKHCSCRWRTPFFTSPGQIEDNLEVEHKCYLMPNPTGPCVCVYCNHPTGLEYEHQLVEIEKP